MSKRGLVSVIGMFLFFMVSFGQGADKPNVLLIMLDDLKDYTGFLGGHPQIQTPHMDKLASEGVVFNNAHTNAPICAPSRASMLMGIYPHVSRNYWFSEWYNNPVLQNCKSLMQFMNDSDYKSYGTGKIMHHRVNSEWTEFGIEGYFGPYAYNGNKVVGHPSVPENYRDIDKNDGLYASLGDIPVIQPSSGVPGYEGWRDTKKNKHFRYVNDDDRDLLNDEESADWAVQKINELNSSNTSEPFFMAVGFVKPHTPLVAPQKYFDMYPLETLQLPVIKENDKDDTFYRSTFTRFTPPWAQHYDSLSNSYVNIEDGLKAYLQAYMACVSFADEQVGKVLSAIENSRFNDNTIVILTSDHGYNLGEKDFLYKNNLWEESTRVPLVIKAPSIPLSSGTTVSNPVSLIDIYPTIADLCAIEDSNMKNEQGAPLSGHSLKPFILGGSAVDNWEGTDVVLTTGRALTSDLEPESHNYSVRSEDFRYILYTNGNEELYNHTDDPYEWTNLENDPNYLDKKEELKIKLTNLLNGDNLSVTDFDIDASVYFNDITNILSIKAQEPSKFQIYSLKGQKVLSSEHYKLETYADASSLSSGIYIVSITLKNGVIAYKKVLIY